MTESAGTTLEGQRGAPTPGARRAARQARAAVRPSESAPRGPVAEDAPGGRRPGRRTGDRARRTAARERRRFWTLTMPAVVTALLVLVAIGAVLRGRDGSVGDAPREARAGGIARSAVLLGHTGADGTADLVLLLGRSGRRGSVLMLPTSTQVEVPSLGIQTLAQVPALGSDALLATSVENLTGVRASPPTLLDDARLAALLTPAAPLTVDLGREVTFEGETRSAIPAGRRRLDAETAARVLTGAQTGSEVDRLVTVQAVLGAWLERLRDPAVAAATVTALAAARPVTTIARLDGPTFDTLPVDSIGTDADERLRVRAGALGPITERLFPEARLGIAGRRPRVEILNGVGRVGLAQAVSALVVPVGADVRLTSNTREFGVAETQVVYYRDTDRIAAQRILRAVGVGSVRKARRALGIADVTIIVGSDFAARNP